MLVPLIVLMMFGTVASDCILRALQLDLMNAVILIDDPIHGHKVVKYGEITLIDEYIANKFAVAVGYRDLHFQIVYVGSPAYVQFSQYLADCVEAELDPVKQVAWKRAHDNFLRQLLMLTMDFVPNLKPLRSLYDADDPGHPALGKKALKNMGKWLAFQTWYWGKDKFPLPGATDLAIDSAAGMHNTFWDPQSNDALPVDLGSEIKTRSMQDLDDVRTKAGQLACGSALITFNAAIKEVVTARHRLELHIPTTYSKILCRYLKFNKIKVKPELMDNLGFTNAGHLAVNTGLYEMFVRIAASREEKEIAQTFFVKIYFPSKGRIFEFFGSDGNPFKNHRNLWTSQSQGVMFRKTMTKAMKCIRLSISNLLLRVEKYH